MQALSTLVSVMAPITCTLKYSCPRSVPTSSSELHTPALHTLNGQSLSCRHAVQVPPWHQRDLQSRSTVHLRPASHAAHTLPPQSTSVSRPFLEPSSQEMQTVRTASHCAVTQSSSVLQPWPRTQRTQAPPPQSTSVSLPFL